MIELIAIFVIITILLSAALWWNIRAKNKANKRADELFKSLQQIRNAYDAIEKTILKQGDESEQIKKHILKRRYFDRIS